LRRRDGTGSAESLALGPEMKSPGASSERFVTPTNGDPKKEREPFRRAAELAERAEKSQVFFSADRHA